jgi:pimeloyl-ACP methyl ester carboxylesterase
MKKILFVLFQGSGTNEKSWNDYTESKFLDLLKPLGSVYVYQDKIHNVWHYDHSNPEWMDYSPNIQMDLSYVHVDHHVKMIYRHLEKKYKHLETYSLIPIGWSAGCYLALYFAQLYKSHCLCTVLLDSALWTPDNMKARLHMLLNDEDGVKYPITEKTYQHMLTNIKKKKDIHDIYRLNNTNTYLRSLFISKHLSLQLSVPTISFINLQQPEKGERSSDFNNQRRLQEMHVLQRINPSLYMPYLFYNKSHYIFNKKQPAHKILSIIRSYLTTLSMK